MAKGTRQTYYFKHLSALREIASEEHLELNGNLLEDLFWEKYVGNDEQYKRHLQLLYTEERTLRETYQHILQTMAYSSGYMQKENLDCIKIIRESIGTTGWHSPEDNYTDYTISNRTTRVDGISEIPKIIIRELEQRTELVKQPILSEKKPWELPVRDIRYKDVLSDPENYTAIRIAEFKLIENDLRAVLSSDPTPGQILDLIIGYWDYFWNFTYVYEAIEYCVTLARDIQDQPIIRKKLREYAISQEPGRTILKLTIESNSGNKNPENRLLAYLKGITRKE